MNDKEWRMLKFRVLFDRIMTYVFMVHMVIFILLAFYFGFIRDWPWVIAACVLTGISYVAMKWDIPVIKIGEITIEEEED